MNLTCPNPENINPLQAGGFILTIDKLPDVSLFAQEASIPGFSLPTASQSSPFVNMNHAGDKISFNPLDIRFIIDANMKNYKAIDNWMRGLGFPESNSEYTGFLTEQARRMGGLSEQAKTVSDGSLFVIGSNQTPIQTISFIDLVPTSISGVPFSTNYTDPEPMLASVTFEYTLYKFI